MEGDVSIMAKVLNNSVWCQYLGEVFIEHGLTLPSLTLANLVVLTSLIFMVRIFSFFFSGSARILVHSVYMWTE